MTEYERARQWRITRNLAVPDLSRMIGYSPESIYAMERGESPSGTKTPAPIKEHVWRRYKCACAAVDAWFNHQHTFKW